MPSPQKQLQMCPRNKEHLVRTMQTSPRRVKSYLYNKVGTEQKTVKTRLVQKVYPLDSRHALRKCKWLVFYQKINY